MGIKATIKRVFSQAARLLVRAHILPDRIVIRMDGGICSQMHFYLVGSMLEARGNKVSYDLEWFSTDGKDLDGRFCRNFDLLKLFPRLNFTTTRGILRRIYLSAFYRHNKYFDNDEPQTAWLGCKSPAYFDGYFHDNDEMYGEVFRRIFATDPAVLSEDNTELLKVIEDSTKGEACAVHVRRGDLSRYNPAYGNPAEKEYFVDSFRKVAMEDTGGIRFFVFSDEPEWFREHMLPYLGDYDITICDSNGSDKGWCDLLLMSRCRHQITSQGSMGKFAALMRPAQVRTGLVTLPPNATSQEWLSRYPRAEIITASVPSERD